MNQSSQLEVEKFLEQFYEKDYLLIALYIPIILVALSANLTVIIIVVKNHHMRRISNYFLVNLSIADLFVTLVCMPNAMSRALGSNSLGKYFCKITAYIDCVAVCSSIFTITAMAMHRYFAITKPLFDRMHHRIHCSTILVITSLWVSSMIVFSPILWVYDLKTLDLQNLTNNTIVLCYEHWSHSYNSNDDNWQMEINSQDIIGILWFTIVFAVPGLIMLVAYCAMARTLCSEAPLFNDDSTCSYQRQLINSRKKAAGILLLLALVFAICWLPKHIMSLMDDTQYLHAEPNQIKIIRRYLLLLGHLNSALNPVIYCSLSKKFRSSIRKLFCRKSCVTQRELTRKLQRFGPVYQEAKKRRGAFESAKFCYIIYLSIRDGFLV